MGKALVAMVLAALLAGCTENSDDVTGPLQDTTAAVHDSVRITVVVYVPIAPYDSWYLKDSVTMEVTYFGTGSYTRKVQRYAIPSTSTWWIDTTRYYGFYERATFRRCSPTICLDKSWHSSQIFSNEFPGDTVRVYPDPADSTQTW